MIFIFNISDIVNIFFGLFIAFFIFVRSQPNTTKTKILNKKIIIIESLIGERLAISIFSMIFCFVGIWILTFSNTIELKIFSSLLIFIPVIFCIKPLIQVVKILANKYKIIEDTLINKKIASELNSDSSLVQSYYFKFQKYKKKVRVYNKKYSTSNINDNFYIVVINGKNDLVGVYNTKYYILKK